MSCAWPCCRCGRRMAEKCARTTMTSSHHTAWNHVLVLEILREPPDARAARQGPPGTAPTFPAVLRPIADHVVRAVALLASGSRVCPSELAERRCSLTTACGTPSDCCHVAPSARLSSLFFPRPGNTCKNSCASHQTSCAPSNKKKKQVQIASTKATKCRRVAIHRSGRVASHRINPELNPKPELPYTEAKAR